MCTSKYSPQVSFIKFLFRFFTSIIFALESVSGKDLEDEVTENISYSKVQKSNVQQQPRTERQSRGNIVFFFCQELYGGGCKKKNCKMFYLIDMENWNN